MSIRVAQWSAGGVGTPGLTTPAMRLVNAIPAVVAAAPGLVTARDLAIGAGRHLLT